MTNEKKQTENKRESSPKIIFTIEETRPSITIERYLFGSRSIPATDVFFKVNREIPTISTGDKKPRVAYESYYSSQTTSCRQTKFYHPETYLLKDGRYKLVLERNEDFHRAIRGLACFIQFGSLGNLGSSGDGQFSERMYSTRQGPLFEIEYQSEELKKNLAEI